MTCRIRGDGGVGTTISVPGSLDATATGQHSIDLTWDSVDGADHYSIFRDDVLVGESLTNSYTDTGLDADTLYTYTVHADCLADADVITAEDKTMLDRKIISFNTNKFDPKPIEGTANVSLVDSLIDGFLGLFK